MEDGKSHHKQIWNEEVTINLKISPRKICKGACVFVVLLLVFYLGRWSIDEPSASTALSEVSLPEVSLETAEKGPGFFSSISGFFTALFADDEVEEAAEKGAAEEKAEKTEEEPDTSKANETVEKEEEGETNEPEAEEENVITSYSKVALAVTNARKEWKGIWGKITYLDYTIKNNEAGTILPDHIIMIVEGYEDFEKKVVLPAGSKKIPAKKAATSAAIIPNGFAYSEKTAGDLTNIKIIFTLYDTNDKKMADYTKEFNLQG